MQLSKFIVIAVVGGGLMAGLPHPVLAGVAEQIEAGSRKAAQDFKASIVETREAAIETGRQFKERAIYIGESVKEGVKNIGPEVRDAVSGVPSTRIHPASDADGTHAGQTNANH